ncbi:MAG: NAD(P)H-hydrate dehydratase [Acidimicrobiia bacterium]
MFDDLNKYLLNRLQNTNKYNYGNVLVVGGSPGMVGAPFLSAMASLRVGAGMVTIASTVSVIDKLEKRVVEIMTLRLPEEPEKQIDTILDFIQKRKVNVLAIGPGMDTKFSDITNLLLDRVDIPVVIDAGAIYSIRNKIIQNKIKNEIVITPHDGEFKKLSQITLPTNTIEREQIYSDFAKEHSLEIVGKGSTTITANKKGETVINTTGNPGLATAGSGDVLTGIIAGLIAQKLSVHEASTYGVYIHGLAADMAAEAKTQPGMIASDIIDYLPDALKA